ncbi:MAG: kelch repeat-containing protein [Myxococcota bacterium]
MRSVPFLHAPIALLTLAACSGSSPPEPQVEADAGALTVDAAPEPDAAALDAAESDAGPADAGPEDSGVPADSGSPQALGWASAMNPPAARPNWGSHLVYVPSEQRFILFGGDTYPIGGPINETWALSATDGSWTKLEVEGDIPPPRYCYCATYLPDTHEILVVGGRTEEAPLPPAAFTLSLTDLRWTAVQGAAPQGVIGCSVEWMPNLGRAIVYGGGSRSVLSDTWSYDPSARRFLRLDGLGAAPAARADAANFYDPISGKMFVFSGAVRAVEPFLMRDDMWAFDGTAWSEVQTSTRPPNRRFASSAYDPISARWYVFGGMYGPGDRDDLWAFDPAASTWEKIELPDRPSARGFAPSAYDPVSGSMLMLGGLTVDFRTFSDGWRLSLPRN